MKKLYILLVIVLIQFTSKFNAQMPTGYPASTASFTNDEEIHEVKINSFTNTSGCAGATAAAWPAANGLPASNVNLYSNYTSGTWPLILITPGSTNTYSLKLGYEAANSFAYTYGWGIFIDYNRNGAFELPAERVANSTTTIGSPTGCNFSIISGTFVAPSAISVGESLMRIVQLESNPTPGPNLTSGWGETEDYKVFLGQKKWDYAINKMSEPDTISFCAQTPQSPKILLSNIENQPMIGGRVDLYISGAKFGSSTNLFFSKAFTSTVLPNTDFEVTFDPILFPKDEMLEFKYVVVNPEDINPGNDTLFKDIQVYKNVTYKLSADTVCFGDSTTVMITDQSKPVFVKWNNESIKDTTKYKMPKTGMVSIQIDRGWKCTVFDSVLAVIKPLPIITKSRDTVLCNGQSVILNASMNMNGLIKWDDKMGGTIVSPMITVDSASTYLFNAKGTNNCVAFDSIKVKVAYPVYMPRVTDTVCLGEIATLGLNNPTTGYLYAWKGSTETTPLIHPTPTVDGQKYNVQWWFEGCTSKDSVNVKVNPLPVVTFNNPAPICPFFSTTLTASGANSYLWRNGFGTNPSITLSPMSSTTYIVKGTDLKGCSSEVAYKLFVHPRTDMIVYSNKFKDNVCLGDSVTIFVNGAKNYSWNFGSTASVIQLVPTASFQWNVIGTDENGCKDTVEYRMTVKPAFKASYIDTFVGCQGNPYRITLSGAKAYDWGNNKTDSFYKIPMLVNSTSFQVTVTSPEDCQTVQSIPVKVMKAPIAQISSLTVCKNTPGILEAKGGTNFEWNPPSTISPTSTFNFLGTTSTDVNVRVYNEAGCYADAITTVKVIDPDLIPVVFKSPLDTYFCPSSRIPITMTATPIGGVWSGTGVTGNKWSTEGLPEGNVQILYSFFDPINGCKVERIKKVAIIYKTCNSGVNDLTSANNWAVYPNPFKNALKIKLESSKSELAVVNLYDISGRIVFTQSHKLNLGENNLEINGLNLSKGTYYVELQTESVSRQSKIIAE